MRKTCLLLLSFATLAILGCDVESSQEPSQEVWEAIANLQSQIDSLSLIPGPPGPEGPPGPPGTMEGDIHADRLAVGSPDFTYNGTTYPRLIVHDSSGAPVTLAMLKYSNSLSNHMVQGRARGSFDSPTNVANNDTVAQYGGQGYLDGEFRKVGAVNMQIDPGGDFPAGMSGKLVFKVADQGTGAYSFTTAAELDSRLRLRLYGALALKYATQALWADEDNLDLGPKRVGVYRLRSDAKRLVTGLAAPTGLVSAVLGETLTLINVGDFEIVLANQNPSSLPENQIITGLGEDLALLPNEVAIIFYDQASLRWRVISTTGGYSSGD